MNKEIAENIPADILKQDSIIKRLNQLNNELDYNEMKLAINNFIWMNGKGDMTIAEAEDKAVRILEIMTEDKKGGNR